MSFSPEPVTGSRPLRLITAASRPQRPHLAALFRHTAVLGLVRAAEMPENDANAAWDPEDIFLVVADGLAARVVARDEILYGTAASADRQGAIVSADLRQDAIAAIAECALYASPGPAYIGYGEELGLEPGDRVLVVQLRASLGILAEDFDPDRRLLRANGGLMLATRVGSAHERMALRRRLDADHAALDRIARHLNPGIEAYVRLDPPDLTDPILSTIA